MTTQTQPTPLTFEQWFKKAEAHAAGLIMLSLHDLADQPYRDWFEAGYTPQEAAEEALENEGFDLDFFEDMSETFEDM
jgi:hypothetical protein